MSDIQKYGCARCGRTLMIGELSSGTVTVKCKKCGAINLITVHPVINIQEVTPAMKDVHNKVMSITLPKIKPTMVTIK